MKLKSTLLLASLLGLAITAHAATELLNVSYDPTRKLYEEYNKLFQSYWKKKTGQDVNISQSHGGSGKQARSVIDGVPADVVTLALAGDIDAIATKGKSVPKDWEERFPHHSTPYTSTIVFVVRPGNPKNIKDWDDIVKEGISIVTPNPKTSGGARWNYLAAWAYAEKKFNNDQAKIKEFIGKLYKNAPVLDTGATGATITFVKRRIGDVYLAWENEAHLIQTEFPGETEIVIPSSSILAEPSVAVVEKNAIKHDTSDLAKAYISYLYSPEGQDLIAKNFYRPRDPKVAEKYAEQFPALELVDIQHFGGWATVQKKHFDDGGIYDAVTKR
ncbi:MAG: sulfate ABC transporter substrate-binding protein [Verrucomicrobia bacterium]|nr:sulfate ABC transporter substrate-binding protein [Verrucomicrobiota bacterium]